MEDTRTQIPGREVSGGSDAALIPVTKEIAEDREVNERAGYDGPGSPVWAASRKPGKNGQRVISLAKLAQLDFKEAIK
jgi:hypothetical protein